MSTNDTAEAKEDYLSEEDQDLVTQIDRDRKYAKEQKKIKEMKDEKKLIHSQIKQNREKFASRKSELISHSKLICHYFSYINDADNREKVREREMEEWKVIELLIAEYCQENDL